jgi:hypothetical protein
MTLNRARKRLALQAAQAMQVWQPDTELPLWQAG